MTQRPIQRAQYTLPPIQSNYILNPERGFFSVVVPEATTNLITNPSFETATTGYSANAGATLARTTDYQRHGVYGLQIDPTAATNDGVAYSLSLYDGVDYTFSADVYGAPGVKYSLVAFRATVIARTDFVGRGRWQRITVSFTGTADASHTLQLLKNTSTSTATLYTDGWQCEEKAYPTTYCDGDQVGFVINQYPPAYLWTGLPHASTSIRSAQTRAGGIVFNLDSYGFRVAAYIGLGMAAVSTVAQPYALLDGAQYQRTVQQSRQFTVTGRFDASTFPQLQRQRSELYDTVKRDAVTINQPMIMKYQAHDCLEPIGEELDLICNYEDGLRGNTNNLNIEDTPLTFTMYLPSVRTAGEDGVSLATQITVSDMNSVAIRATNAVWFGPDTGTNGLTYAVQYGTDGLLYVGGSYSQVGANPAVATNSIAKYNPVTNIWAALGTGAASGDVYCLAVAPNGDIYAGGDFLDMGGVAAADRIARWNIATSTWTALGNGAATGTVRALAFDGSGNLIAGGSFLLMDGVASTSRIAKWNGTAWSAMGTGTADGTVLALAVGLDGTTVYAGGSYTSMGGVANTPGLAKWSGTAWSSIATGSFVISTLDMGPDGLLYAGGGFTAISGVAVVGIARYNGVSWAPMGSGAGAGTGVNLIRVAPDGTVYTGGLFTTMGGITTPDGQARWNGSAWVIIDADLPGTATVSSVSFAADGQMAIGFDTSGTGTTGAFTFATNIGTANTYPILTIKGPTSGTSRIYEVINTTTGKNVYLNYTINAGETAVFNFDPLNFSFVSDFQGNLLSKVLPGSQQAEMYLRPGSNSISFFAAVSTVTATLRWTPAYNSVDDATR